MRLYIQDGHLYRGRVQLDTIDHARVAAVLIEQGRYPAIAQILAFGGSLDTSAARQFGKELGLIEKDSRS